MTSLEQLKGKISQLDIAANEYLNSNNVRGANMSSVKGGNTSNADYIDQLEVLNRLSVIQVLIDDFKNNSASLKDEINNYKKLVNKVAETRSFLNSKGIDENEIIVLRALNEETENLKKDLTRKQFERLESTLKIDGCNFKFTELEPYSFTEFLSMCEELQKNKWITEKINWDNKLSAWMNDCLSKLDDHWILKFENLKTGFELKSEKSTQSLLNYTLSIESLIKLMNLFIKDTFSMKYVKQNLAKQLLANIKMTMFNKINIYPLIVDQFNRCEENEQSAISHLKNISSELSKDGWSRDGICELEFWIDDLATSWVSGLADSAIDKFKHIIMKISNGEFEDAFLEEKLITKVLSLDSTSKQATDNAKEPQVKIDENWDESWDDDNGAWDEEMDLEENDKNINELELGENVGPKEAENDDDWGWGDDDDLNLDEEPIVEKNHTEPTIPITSYQKTRIPTEFTDIIENYYSNLKHLSTLIEEDQITEVQLLFNHNLKNLAISILMMMLPIIEDTYKNSILFYNDYTSILEFCFYTYSVQLDTVAKMAGKIVNSYLDSSFSRISRVINDYDNSLWCDGSDKYFQEKKTEFIIRLSTQVEEISMELSSLRRLNTQLVSTTETKILFKVLDTICEKIFSRENISSDESEWLASLIDEVVNIVKNLGELELSKIQSFSKIKQVQIILNSGLRDILEQFYEAIFFDLETYELIGLITALFSESNTRIAVIEQIESARETEI
ncbi:hypothetical protein DAMA08_005350 [Martiniozyma asiatica (nom. inval.)]|nr:hypothetical protein DAMA08_005350 [Martiniozyma asiatica]